MSKKKLPPVKSPEDAAKELQPKPITEGCIVRCGDHNFDMTVGTIVDGVAGCSWTDGGGNTQTGTFNVADLKGPLLVGPAQGEVPEEDTLPELIQSMDDGEIGECAGIPAVVDVCRRIVFFDTPALLIITAGMEITHPYICNAAENAEVLNVATLIVQRANELSGTPAAGVFRLPAEEELPGLIEQVSNDKGVLELLGRLYNEAQTLYNTKNTPPAPPPPSAEQLEILQYNALLKQYGKDFVTADRGKNVMYFTRLSWNQMGKSKQGWVERPAKMPPTPADK